MPNIFIRYDMGTNLSLKTGYYGCFRGFPQYLQANAGKVPRLGHERHPSIDAMQPETAKLQRRKIKYRGR